MPKIVDHEERRDELAAAVWRLASREGLDALTLRAVAAEAGWSTGALAHYFADKEELLLFAFETVADRVGRRVAAAPSTRATRSTCRARSSWPRAFRSTPSGAPRCASGSPSWALRRPARGLAKAQRDAYRVWRDRVAKTCCAQRRAWRIDPASTPELEAAALVALVDGLAVQATFEPRASARAPAPSSSTTAWRGSR